MLNIIFVILFYAIACAIVSLVFLCMIFYCVNMPRFIHSPNQWTLGCVYYGAIMCIYLFLIYMEVEWLGHKMSTFGFGITKKQLFNVVISIHFHQQYIRCLVDPHIHQEYVFSTFILLTI